MHISCHNCSHFPFHLPLPLLGRHFNILFTYVYLCLSLNLAVSHFQFLSFLTLFTLLLMKWYVSNILLYLVLAPCFGSVTSSNYHCQRGSFSNQTALLHYLGKVPTMRVLRVLISIFSEYYYYAI